MSRHELNLFDTLDESDQRKIDKMAKHDPYAEPLEIDKTKSEVFRTRAPLKRRWNMFRSGRRLTVRSKNEWQRLFKDSSKNDGICFGEIVLVGDCLEKFGDNMGHPLAHKFLDFFEISESVSVFRGEPTSMRYFVSERQLGEVGQICHILSVPLSAVMCYRMSIYMLNNDFYSDVLEIEAKSFEKLMGGRCSRLINLMHDVLVPCKSYRIVRPELVYLNQALDLMRHLLNLYVEENEWSKVKIQEIIVELNKDIELSIKGYIDLTKRHEDWIQSRKERYGVDVLAILESDTLSIADLTFIRDSFNKQQAERMIERFEEKIGTQKLTDEQKDMIRLKFTKQDDNELT